MTPVIAYIAARMKEPSTWAGISTILIGFKVLPNDSSLAGTLTTFGVTFGGVLAALLNEGPAIK
jgi:hypothetical protein